MTLRATLVTDGASDVVLVPILQWLTLLSHRLSNEGGLNLPCLVE